MMRALGLLVTVVLAIAAAVISWPQFFKLEHVTPFAQITALRGALVIAFLALAVVSLLFVVFRRTRGFGVSLLMVFILAAGANIGILASRGLGADSLPEKQADSVRVMTWNTDGEAASAQQIAETAIAMDADVVALPETANEVGEDVAITMREMGRPMWVHHVAFNEEIKRGPQAWQTTLLISPRLGEYSVVTSTSDGESNTQVVPSVVAMPVDGKGPTIVAVHAVAPRPAYMESWRSDLQWVANQCPGGNVIMAGDFNSTIDHFAGFATDGDLGACNDTASRTGNGAVGTWPTTAPALLGAPIDHVLATSNWTASGSVILRKLEPSESDHRPLIVQLDPAPSD